MSKHRYLISKYHWKSRKRFTKLSADSAFSFLGIESKMKTWNLPKVFKECHIPIYTSSTSSKVFQSLLKYIRSISNLSNICFHLGKRSSIYQFFAWKKVQMDKSNFQKLFAVHINIGNKWSVSVLQPLSNTDTVNEIFWNLPQTLRFRF